MQRRSTSPRKSIGDLMIQVAKGPWEAVEEMRAENRGRLRFQPEELTRIYRIQHDLIHGTGKGKPEGLPKPHAT